MAAVCVGIVLLKKKSVEMGVTNKRVITKSGIFLAANIGIAVDEGGEHRRGGRSSPTHARLRNGHCTRDWRNPRTVAMSRSNNMAHGLCMKDTDDLKPGPGFNGEMKEIIGLCTLAQFFDYSVDAGQEKLVKEIDEFYSDSENTLIPIDFALEYVRDKLKGNTTPNDLKAKLTKWRQIVNKK